MSANAEGKSFYDMTDTEFKAVLSAIVTASATEGEVCRRLKAWGYPYTIAITSHQPVTAEDRAVSEVIGQLGGLHLTTGAMVMIMAHAPSGATITA